jgi:hypothetical protein
MGERGFFFVYSMIVNCLMYTTEEKKKRKETKQKHPQFCHQHFKYLGTSKLIYMSKLSPFEQQRWDFNPGGVKS